MLPPRLSSGAAVRASATSLADPRQVLQGTALRKATLQPHYDAIVIGSGMGGLTAAVGLAKFGGQRVLVLEQHTTAGGFTHAFRRGQFAWNVGVHYIGGGVGERGGEVFAPFNAFTGGQVAWAKLPDVHDRLVIENRVYDIVTGRDAWLEKMAGYFPKERAALVRFLELADAAGSAYSKAGNLRPLPGWLSNILHPFAAKAWADLAGQSLADMLNGLTQDKELQAVLAGSWPDVGLPPGSVSAGYYLVAYNSYLDGAYIPVGGASSIAAAMIPLVEATGGAVVTSADVQQIMVKGGKAVGVRLADGREITAKVVISNAGLLNTYTKLLPPDTLAGSPAMQHQLEQAAAAGTSLGAAVLYLGFNEPLVPEFQGVGTLRLYPSADHDANLASSVADPEAPFSVAEICCCDGRERVMPDNPAGAAAAASSNSGQPSTSSSGPGAPGVSTLQIITFADYDGWFSKWADTKWRKRGDAYEAFKQELQDRLLSKLGEVFPDLPGRVACSEVSTPLSTEHFSRWPKGGIYGISASAARFRLTGGQSWGPATPLPGLLLTGQDAAGDGILSAFLAGTWAARLAGGTGTSLSMLKEISKWT